MGCDDVGPRVRGGDDCDRDRDGGQTRDPDQEIPFDRTLSLHSSQCSGLGLGRTRFETGRKLGLILVGPRPVHVMAHGLAHEGDQNPPPSQSLRLSEESSDWFENLGYAGGLVVLSYHLI